MEQKTIQILMIDDHPSMIEGYKSILAYNELGFQIEVTPAYDSKTAFEILTSNLNANKFDFIFIDLSLPVYEEQNIKSGEDLAVIAKKQFPEAKIAIITSHAEAFILFNIQKHINPDGLLVKSDFTAEDFLNAFEDMVNGEKYLSKTVKEAIKDLISNKKFIDEINREIIMLLGQGVKSKSLPNYINLSMSAIDKRKTQIRDILQIKNGNDEDIVREAKKLGFI
ncbi:response regulator [Flavobacterium chuncheonense]|uniref:Response regulator n=1 Tax=Flavobacterium chuncheonense TaxID=2026653 RepID=A0ABW5YM70_9FLAO